jgi:23S rRNA (pseudouridine1915-N3)-methyltransferase
MKITLLAVGKTDDSRMEQLTQMYVDRLQHYINFELEIIPDLKVTLSLYSTRKARNTAACSLQS